MAGEDCQAVMRQYVYDLFLPVVVSPRDAVVITTNWCAPHHTSAEMSERHSIEQQLQQRQSIHVDAPDHGCRPDDAPDQGCQPEEERLPDEARLAELHEELRRQGELLAWQSSSLACLKKIRGDVVVER